MDPELAATITSLQTQVDQMRASADATWLLRSSFSIIAMQTGFAALEGGFVRSRNTVTIMMKNLVDMALGAIVFFVCGWAFAWGDTAGGFIGKSQFAMVGVEDTRLAFAVFQYSFSATAITIVSGAVAERIKFRSYMIMAMVLTAFVYPVVVHWVWHEDGWLYKRDFVDLAGDAPVHMVGGFAGLAGALCLGPRLGRFPSKTGRDDIEAATIITGRTERAGPEDNTSVAGAEPADTARRDRRDTVLADDGDEDDLADSDDNTSRSQLAPMSSPSYAVLGLFLLVIGWFSFNSASVGSVAGDNAALSAKVAMTTTLAAAAGTTTGIFLSLVLDREFIDVRRSINCTLAALVAITGPCHVVSLWASMVIGMVGAIVVTLAEMAITALRIDDPLSAFAVHGVGGMTGLILTGLFHEERGLFIVGSADLLGTQIIGTLAVAAFSFAMSMLLFLLCKYTYGLRVSAAHEMIGADGSEHNIVRFVDAEMHLITRGIRALAERDPEARKVRHRFMRRSRSFVVLPKPARAAAGSVSQRSYLSSPHRRLSRGEPGGKAAREGKAARFARHNNTDCGTLPGSVTDLVGLQAPPVCEDANEASGGRGGGGGEDVVMVIQGGDGVGDDAGVDDGHESDTTPVDDDHAGLAGGAGGGARKGQRRRVRIRGAAASQESRAAEVHASVGTKRAVVKREALQHTLGMNPLDPTPNVGAAAELQDILDNY